MTVDTRTWPRLLFPHVAAPAVRIVFSERLTMLHSAQDRMLSKQAMHHLVWDALPC